MTVLRIVAAAALRILALVALYAGFVAALEIGGSDDAFGAGLLFFLMVVVLAGLWATWDGLRRGLVTAAVVWLLVGATAGLALALAAVGLDATSASVTDEARDGWLFLGLLVAVPAWAGTILGGLVRRAGARTA